MENTSASELAHEVLQRCLASESWQSREFDSLIEQATSPETAREASRAFFGILVEGLADRFQPRLCDAYAELFCDAVGRVLPEVWPGELLTRYRRIREVRPFFGDANAIEHVFVLSRVTLGADVVVTSTVMAGLKQRFPRAVLNFVGPKKNFELFAADERVQHVPLEYRRGGTLADRLQVWPELQGLVNAPQSIVVDPDSRYTQLGLLPVCANEERYFFFESRAFGGESDETLASLTQRWVEWTFGVSGVAPYVAVDEPVGGPAPDVCISLGVGENESKRVPDPFEAELVQLLADNGRRLCIDSGAGEQERIRVGRAIAGLPAVPWVGSFASFAAQIERAGFYVGYDSAGQHVAAACGVPLVSVFAGEVSERMFARWRPSGRGPATVVRVSETPDPLAAVRAALP